MNRREMIAGSAATLALGCVVVPVDPNPPLGAVRVSPEHLLRPIPGNPGIGWGNTVFDQLRSVGTQFSVDYLPEGALGRYGLQDGSRLDIPPFYIVANVGLSYGLPTIDWIEQVAQAVEAVGVQMEQRVKSYVLEWDKTHEGPPPHLLLTLYTSPRIDVVGMADGDILYIDGRRAPDVDIEEYTRHHSPHSLLYRHDPRYYAWAKKRAPRFPAKDGYNVVVRMGLALHDELPWNHGEPQDNWPLDESLRARLDADNLDAIQSAFTDLVTGRLAV